MELLLQTQDLCKSFSKQTAVERVSLHIERGTVYGLLGPNGAGKSTILKMLTGIYKPSSGSIWFDGKPWSRESLSQIGALIEQPPIYENLSAYENLKLRALLLDVADERIKEVLELVGLANTGKKKAGAFSLGMKERLGIAMALLANPRLLILDEPTNGLDPMGIESLRDLITSLAGDGMTIILSSHILSEVQLLANWIGILNGGALVYEGPLKKEQNLEALFTTVMKAKRGGGKNAYDA